MPGLPGAEVVEVALVIQLSISADQVCSQLRKWLKEVSAEYLRIYTVWAFACLSACIFLWEQIHDPKG